MASPVNSSASLTRFQQLPFFLSLKNFQSIFQFCYEHTTFFFFFFSAAVTAIIRRTVIGF